MRLGGVSAEMGWVIFGKVLAFGGVEVQLPFFGPAGDDVEGVLENIMAVSGGDEFDVICIEEAVCWQVVQHNIDVDDRALGDTIYGLNHSG